MKDKRQALQAYLTEWGQSMMGLLPKQSNIAFRREWVETYNRLWKRLWEKIDKLNLFKED